jgi:hypothetical protein
MRLWRRLHGFRRSAITAGVVGGVLVAQFAVGASGAQADTTTTWIPGTGNAVAQALALAPTTAGLGYNVVLGTSIADFQQQEGQAESRTFNGGALVLAATSTQCDGSAPVVSADKLPQPAIAETANGNQTKNLDISTQYGAPVVPIGSVGSELATVTTQPTAKAITKVADIVVPGALEISGIQSSAFAQQVVGQYRQATSTADIAELSLGGGVVVLKGLHWENTQETGPDGSVIPSASKASFSITGGTVGGLPVSADQLTTVFQVVNTALAGLGFHITMPTTTTLDDGQVNLSPLSIGIDNSALGQELIGANLSQLETVRQALDQALLGVTCKAGNATTIRDVAVGVLAGGGSLDLQLGGAQAVTTAPQFANPFGNNLGVFTPDNGTGAGDLGLGADTGSVTPGIPGTPGTPGTSGTAGTGGRKLAVSKTSHCLTTSPFGHPGCSSGGAAVPIGLVGLALVIGMGAADYFRARRYRRFAPDEV